MSFSRADPKKHRRVTWCVRRVPDGWLPVVLIGEEPVVFGAVADKRDARAAARRQARAMRNLGQQ